jgi:hypothetical protein
VDCLLVKYAAVMNPAITNASGTKQNSTPEVEIPLADAISPSDTLYRDKWSPLAKLH